MSSFFTQTGLLEGKAEQETYKVTRSTSGLMAASLVSEAGPIHRILDLFPGMLSFICVVVFPGYIPAQLPYFSFFPVSWPLWDCNVSLANHSLLTQFM